jgi:hypothetical protein
MLCALTVRKLQPGSMEEFRQTFPPKDQEFPPGWKRFFAIQNVNDENEVITFGLFDGTLEELRSTQDEGGYEERRKSVDEMVESVGADGIYEVLEERSMD